MKPVVATVIGDPAGVGPEVCVKALATGEPQQLGRHVLIGSARQIEHAIELCGLDLAVRTISSATEAIDDVKVVNLLCPEQDISTRFAFGQISADAAQAALRWLRMGIDLAESGQVAGLVMGPFDSSALKLAGYAMDGSEFEPAGTWQFRIGGGLRVVPITEHVRLRDVASHVTTDNIIALLRVLNDSLRKWGIARPRIGVAGLNPHAMFEEERQEITPAIAAATAAGIDAIGPISPDVIFRQGIDGEYDAIITMYHDQGQIAIKTVAFDRSCTVFLGLPYIRIGIPHGSAMDIAGTGQVLAGSTTAAMTTLGALAARQFELASV
ncbi:D-erythronate 4-phosphate dehydrogenase (plasmid) [Sphingobium sp. AntQ-1]|uniref:PdxA family dehydrogenase n=1 Tax=Sphingobium sp. AntQ-1 TaxID=2930091 RepID=UPI00234F5CE8|nr:4-hydroxythreonine-4-phosphate dehydrogenase PdxA [Sphingobium sp. AntQ-1]WCP15968.1 D-erythronate 4-phosphate dehydrogenase [Sphingobium sp. AntQ-1]